MSMMNACSSLSFIYIINIINYLTEPPWSTQHQVDLISCVEDKSLSLTQPPSETFRGILTSLLNILVDPYTKEPALDGSTDGKKSAEEGAADEVLSAASSAAGSADLSATPNQLLQRLLTETSSTTVAATEKLKKAGEKYYLFQRLPSYFSLGLMPL